MNTPPPHLHRLPLLDGMRGIAAIGVMLYHVRNLFGIPDIFARSYLCVDFFFLLSGFVLTRAAEPRMTGNAAAANFLRGRVRRLWPLVAVGVMLGALQQGLDGTPLALLTLRVAAALLMVPFSWCAIQIFSLNGPQWSLLMELIANAVHAIVLRRIGRVGLIAAAALAGLALTETIVWQGSVMVGPERWTWPLAVPRVLYPYSLGVLMARRWRPEAATLPWWWGPVLLPAVVLGITWWPNIAVGDGLTALVLLPAVFWLCIRAKGPVPRWAEALGQLSFPLYAIQIPILLMISRVDHHPVIALPAMAFVLLASHFVGRVIARRPSPRLAPCAGLAPA